MPSWGWFLIFGCLLMGVCVGFGIAALFTGAAYADLAQDNYRLMTERDSALGAVTELRRTNGQLERLVNTVTPEEAA